MSIKYDKEKGIYHIPDAVEVVITNGYDGVQPTIGIKTKTNFYMITPTPDQKFCVTDEMKVGKKYDLVNGNIKYMMSPEQTEKHRQYQRQKLLNADIQANLRVLFSSILSDFNCNFIVISDVILWNYNAGRINKTNALKLLKLLQDVCDDNRFHVDPSYLPDTRRLASVIKSSKVEKINLVDITGIVKHELSLWNDNVHYLVKSWWMAVQVDRIFGKVNFDYYRSLGLELRDISEKNSYAEAVALRFIGLVTSLKQSINN